MKSSVTKITQLKSLLIKWNKLKIEYQELKMK
jgi:hypothetical protein